MDALNLKNKRILITGANGYLGNRLKTTLQSVNANVFSISRTGKSSEKDFIVDITDKISLQKAINAVNPDVVFHLAALIDRNRDFSIFPEMYRVNVEGTSNVIDTLLNTDCEHFIFTSSSEIYGNNASPFHEKLLPKPVSPYSLSKTMAEFMIEMRLKNHKMHYTIARIFNFYGPEMSESFFINEMINTLKNGKDFKMTLGEQYRDFLFVDDVVSALLLMVQQPKAKQEIINVCSGNGTKIKEIAIEVQQYFKGKVLFGAIPYRENEVWEMIGDATKLKEILHYKPQFSLSEGIRKLIETPKL